MSSESTGRAGGEGGLSTLERNRYFYGKLMTPRDMRDEQSYHRVRLDTLARFVAGTGIVAGLEATGLRERRGSDGRREIEVAVEPGVAVDGEGRLLVLDAAVRPEFDAPGEDVAEVHVRLGYGEEAAEPVPTPDLGSAVAAGCEENRLVERPAVTCEYLTAAEAAERRSAGLEKPVPAVDLDPSVLDGGDGASPGDPVVGALARAAVGSSGGRDSRGATVFLGAFERSGGEWRPTGAERRPLVYTNDALYAALVRHVLDGDRHGGGGGVPRELRERIERLEADLADARERLSAGEERLRTLERYTMDRTLEDMLDAFRDVAAEFEGSVAGAAAEDLVSYVTEYVYEHASFDPTTFHEVIAGAFEYQRQIRDEVRDEATGRSFRRFDAAVDELAATLEEVGEPGADEAPVDVLRLALAQDRVDETARWLVNPYLIG